jgi:HSP20 family molecular chaperone IbpA
MRKAENNRSRRVDHRSEGRRTPATWLYKGIAERTFERSFQLADHVVVKGASLENGLCTSTS